MRVPQAALSSSFGATTILAGVKWYSGFIVHICFASYCITIRCTETRHLAVEPKGSVVFLRKKENSDSGARQTSHCGQVRRLLALVLTLQDLPLSSLHTHSIHQSFDTPSFQRFWLDLKITRGAGTDTQHIYMLPKECCHGRFRRQKAAGWKCAAWPPRDEAF